ESSESRDDVQQDVHTTEEPDQEAVGQVALADDHRADLLAETVREGRGLLHLFVYGGDSRVHRILPDSGVRAGVQTAAGEDVTRSIRAAFGRSSGPEIWGARHGGGEGCRKAKVAAPGGV